MAITVSNIEICSVPADLNYFTTRPSNTGQDVRNYFSNLGSNIYDLSGNGSFTTIFENSILEIKAKANKSASRPSMTQIQFYDKRTSSVARTLEPNNLRGCYMALGYDETESKAYLILTGQFYYSDSWTEDPYAVFTCGVLGSTSSEIQTMYELISGSQISTSVTAPGGGATHIAKVTGHLSALSSNLSDILIVAGGGGGGMIIDSVAYDGADAGGISGSGTNSANQSTGYAFGQGESGTGVSGGGSGLYGGYKGTPSKSSGAGSGYIGNSLLSNKKMVGYNVPTSSDTSTKTESTQYHYSNASSNCSKMGDGYAKIIFIKSPPDGIIPLLKNGTLKRDDCLVPDPYISYDNLKTASSVLTASGYEIIAEDDQTTHPLSQASYFQTSLTSNNDPYSSRTFKPLLATNSQNNKYILLNKFKVKFDLEVNIPATDSGFKFKPQLTTHSYFCNLGYYAIGDEYIRSDPNTATTISVQNIETNWIDYEDYNGADANEQPYLTFSLNCSDIAPFYMKLTIKEINVKLSSLLIPDTIPEVSFNINTTTSGKQGWKINEIYQNIILLGYNSFLLCPISGTSGTTTFYIVAFNLTNCNELYTARDYYIGNSNGYNRFGIETTDTLSGLDIYDADATSSRKILVKRQGSTTSFPNTTTKDDHTYLWRQVASYSGRYSYVFYSDCYKKLYINNKFVFEK